LDDLARTRWRQQTLEFLSVRAATMSHEWTPATARTLAEAISGADWELLLGANALSAPHTSEYARLLPRLVQRELQADWSRRVTISSGRIKGLIDYPRTTSERQRSGNVAAFVYRQLDRSWDTPENVTLAGFISHAERVGRAVMRAFDTTSGWRAVLADTTKSLRQALNTAPLRYVAPDPNWSVKPLRSVRRRSALYAETEQLARAWAFSRRALSGDELRGVLRNGWLIPATDDSLFEIFLLSLLVEALHDARSWDAFQLVPTGLRGRTAEAWLGKSKVTLSFDSGLSRALGRSVPGEYRWIFETYDGLDLAARRPDVTLHVRGASEIVVLFEAKATDANSAYGRDSIYKALGYLKDFEKIWSAFVPKVVLVLAGGVASSQPLSIRLERDLLLTSEPQLEHDIRAVINRALKSAGL
jgi:hypothetical protein